jgi:bacillithiol system protein YtxJ
MGLFRRFSRPTEPKVNTPGQTDSETRLRTQDDWQSLLDESRDHPVLVFKHSTVCDISSQALQELTQFLEAHQSTRLGIVHVVEDRPLSNAIAQHTGIRHETPQLIAIENERPVWHGSHWKIDLGEVEQLVS